MYKTRHMDQCRLGAGRHQKCLHRSNFTCTNLHNMQMVFRDLRDNVFPHSLCKCHLHYDDPSRIKTEFNHGWETLVVELNYAFSERFLKILVFIFFHFEW